MTTIQDILTNIREVDINDKIAREKIVLYWHKLFLMEKDMSRQEKMGLFLQVDNGLMNKRIYNWDLSVPVNNDEDEQLLSNVINSVYQELYNRGFIDYTYLNPCTNLCKDVALLLFGKLSELNMKVEIIHTKSLNIPFVPHFFTIVTYNGKKYVVDPTFRQFLVLPHFIPEIIYHFKDNFLSPAYFGNDDFFISLGEKGFFEATEENLAIYFEGLIKASDTTLLHDVSELVLVRERKITSRDYINRLDNECRKFDIERYASYLAS